MNTKQWLNAVRGYPKRLRRIDRSIDDGLPAAMFAFWRLLRQAPSTELALYERIKEEELLSLASAATPSLCEPAFGFDPPKDENDLLATVRYIAAWLRATDLLSADLHTGSLEPDPAEAYRVRFGSERAFVIPVERRLWRLAKKPEDDKSPFFQRGVVKHRILPGEIDGAKVVPYRGHWPSPLGERANFGAALFPNLQFASDEDETSFLVTGVSCAVLEDVVDHAIARSHLDNCLATIFPELTIDDTMLERIGERLGLKPWYDEDDAPVGRTPAFIIAGSWHRTDKGRCYNLAPVRDGDGLPILNHRKRKPFKDKEGRYERIESGKELPVLIFDHCLFAFGICLDFCDQLYPLAYDDLDVDMILVPSCGHDSTMESHLENARILMKRRKSRTMVVQQIYPEDTKLAGYVLPPQAKLASTISGFSTDKSWTTFEAHFSHTR